MNTELAAQQCANETITGIQPGVVLDPTSLVNNAINQGCDVDQLERLLAMKERWEANEARKAFVAAMSRFQSEVPRIEKKKAVDFTSAKGRTNYNYAPLCDIIESIKGSLANCGLSFRWENVTGERGLKVTCFVTHIDGHSEQAEMCAPMDNSGNKNLIQGHGSTLTYLQRYTLCAVLGLASADKDIDGRLPESVSPTLTAEQLEQIHNLLDDIESKHGEDARKKCSERLKASYRVDSIGDIKQSVGDDVVKVLERWKANKTK